MTTSRSTEFRNIQNIVLKLPHGHFMGDLHTSSMSLSFLYVSVHSADLLGNTSELAFRWIALLLSLQTRRLTEGSSIAPAPYSKEQEEIRETSLFVWSFFWGWVDGFKLVVFLSEEATNSTTNSTIAYSSKVRDTPKNPWCEGCPCKEKTTCFCSDVCRKGKPLTIP